MHAGKLIAKALKKSGVECVFTLSGGHIMPIYDGCLDEGIRIIDVRHEQAAVHAADAWARLHPGVPGCALLTAGPGATDGVTGIANAWRANSPILVIGGQGPLANLRKGSLQEMDHISVMRPITKWAEACYAPDRAGEYVEEAVRLRAQRQPRSRLSRSADGRALRRRRSREGVLPRPAAAGPHTTRSAHGRSRRRDARAGEASDGDGRHRRQVVERRRRAQSLSRSDEDALLLQRHGAAAAFRTTHPTSSIARAATTSNSPIA